MAIESDSRDGVAELARTAREAVESKTRAIRTAGLLMVCTLPLAAAAWLYQEVTDGHDTPHQCTLIVYGSR